MLNQHCDRLRQNIPANMEAVVPEMKPEEFRLLQEYLEKTAGIVIDGGRERQLRLRLGLRLSELRLSSFFEYYAYLKFDPRGEAERGRFFSLVANHETYFFRELPQLTAFSQIVLPELAARKKKEGENRIRVLSAGCSSGEEPYTLAILLADSGLFDQGWEIEVQGVDIDPYMIARASAGLYGERSLSQTAPAVIDRHFRKTSEGYHIRDRAKKLCRFATGNILDLPQVADRPCDIIFCRNVLIYFRDSSIRRVAEHFTELLAPGGLLFLGHAEAFTRMSENYSPVLFAGAMAYRKNL